MGAGGEAGRRAVSGAPKVQVLVDGLGIGESPRWHEGRLWFSHWGAGEVVSVDLDGNFEVEAPGRPGLGWATAWLPDGRLLVTGETLLRREPDGSFVEHADISTVCTRGCSEIVVDGRSNIYVNSIEFDFLGGGEPTGGVIALIRPDGSVRRVAGDLAFPNGMVITPDNATLIVGESFASRLTAFDIGDDGSLTNRRAWADGIGPDGITIDAEGAIWCSSVVAAKDCARVLEGGEITRRIELEHFCFACMLGGPDRRSLFMLTADWLGPEHVDETLASRTGRVLMTEVDVPGVGWP
jgi:sugar lactone lactonase YvrE